MEHALLVSLFESRPLLALSLLREVAGVPLNASEPAELASVDMTQAVPAEYRADLVVRYLGGREPLVVVVEVQRDRDSDKRYSWPVYVTLLRERFRCDVELLVFSPDPAVASWCRQPIRIGSGAVFTPTVVSLAEIPAITDEARATAEPELSVLSALAHGSSETNLAVRVAYASLRACQNLEGSRGMVYFDLVYTALSEAAREAIEAMIPEGYEFKSDFAKKYLAEGRAEGEARGRAEAKAAAVLAVFEARGLPVSAEQRARVEACTDSELLDRWLRAAATAPEASLVFEG